jgi:hypothetical protein
MIRCIFIILAGCLCGSLPAQAQYVQQSGNITPGFCAYWITIGVIGAEECAINTGNVNVLYAANFPGPTAGDQISECVAALPSTGGVCDARGLPSGGTIPTLTINKSGVQILGPCGQFQVTGSIIIRGVGGVRWSGCATASYAGVTTAFIWYGNASDPMFRLQGVRDSQIEDIYVSLFDPLAVAFQSETLTGFTASNNHYINIIVDGINGFIDKVFRWCTGNACGSIGGDANNDLNYLQNVNVANYGTCAFSIEHSQSKTHTFANSSMNRGQRGVCTTQGGASGSFRWYGGGGGANTVADFDLGGADDLILIESCNLESSNRLLQTSSGTSAWPITIEGCRWSADALNADNNVVFYQQRGPLNIIGNTIESPVNVVGRAPQFTISQGGVARGNAEGNSINWTAATAASQPFISSGSNAFWETRGNLITDLSSNQFAIPDITLSPTQQAPVLNVQTCSVGNAYALVPTDITLIINDAAGSCTLTLPNASSFPGRSVTVKTVQAQTVVSAASNVVPLAGGAAGTAILANSAGKWATMQSDGTNWNIMSGN